MKCKSCGEENTEGREFCKSCGDYLEKKETQDSENIDNKTEEKTATQEIVKDDVKPIENNPVVVDKNDYNFCNYKPIFKNAGHCYKKVDADRVSPFSKWIAFLLCLLLGFLGMHRFYVGKIGTAILYLLTFGFCGIGIIVDLIMIVVGSYTDNDRLYLQE